MRLKKKFNIGVWVDTNYNPTVGGGYGYYSQIIEGLLKLKPVNYDLIFVGYNINSLDFSEKKTLKINKKETSLLNRIFNKICNLFLYKLLRIKRYSQLQKQINRNQNIKKQLSSHLDLIYYPTSTVEFEFFPFIHTLWDLGHKISYSFPELIMNGNFESRRNYHDQILNKALLVLCESNFGKQQLQKYFHINEDRIKVIPIFPSNLTSKLIIERKPVNFNFNDFFIHYPAQFWAHKNHYNLIVSFKEVLKKYPTLNLLLTGSDKGNMGYIKNLIQELNLVQNIHILGFVEVEELKWIYKKSSGMIMPSIMGPTSMPLLEAASLGCKVACSNIDGHKEQLGNYAIYFDPLKPIDISKAIILMLESPLREFTENQFSIENSMNLLNSVFEDVIPIRRCWGDFDQIN
jgi:glycosyltransferase involved in cell wall biosynthesis